MIANKVISMKKKAKEINDIKHICNTILANGCYHEKEMEVQIATAEKNGNLTNDELEAITLAWELRSKKAKELINELQVFLKNEEK